MHHDASTLMACGFQAVRQLKLPVADGQPAPLWLTSFDAARFDLAAFALHGIAMPDRIGTSVRKRQAEYFCGRYAARAALQQLGMSAVDIGTGVGREPLWPGGVAGSITHNVNYAAAVVIPLARATACGIDIETIADGGALDALLALAVSQREQALLAALEPRMPLAALVSLVFSAKESFFKAAYREVGRYFDFDAVEVANVDLEARTLTFTIRQDLSPRLRPGDQRSVHFQWVDTATLLTGCTW